MSFCEPQRTGVRPIILLYTVSQADGDVVNCVHTVECISQCFTCLGIIGLSSHLECLFVYGLWTSCMWYVIERFIAVVKFVELPLCTVPSFTTSLPNTWHIFVPAALAFVPSSNVYSILDGTTLFVVPLFDLLSMVSPLNYCDRYQPVTRGKTIRGHSLICLTCERTMWGAREIPT